MVRPMEAPFGATEMDELDRRIMRVLRLDGRASYASIARALGISDPLTQARVNPPAIGFPVDAMVGIRVNRGYGTDVASQLAAMENVAYLGYTTGSFDILVETYLHDNVSLHRFLNEDLGRIEGISNLETWHILKTDKTPLEWEGENVGMPPLPDEPSGT